MNEELKAVVETAAPEQAAAEAPAPAETVAQEPEAAAETQAEAQEPVESMADYAKELEASYKAFDERHFEQVPEEEGPEAEKWAELRQMMEDKTVIKVKIKEAVKAGVTAYVDEIQAFIPASQISTQYVEKLEDRKSVV